MNTKKLVQPPAVHQLIIPNSELPHTMCISDQARRSGIHIMAGSGHGKSRFLGRVLSFTDCYRGIPTVILDPVGATINHLMDKVSRLSEGEQRSIWPRFHYIDMSGEGEHVIPFPLYYRLSPPESLTRVARRYIETLKRFDPHLEEAPVRGYAPLKFVGLHLGIVLAALDLQITEAENLLDKPAEWEPKLRELSNRNTGTEVQRAVSFFTNTYPKLWSAYKRDERTESFRERILDITLDDGNRAIFGASQGFDWDRVVRERLTVAIDFSTEVSEDLRQFKALWVLESFLSYVQHRGLAGRAQPISLIIDELAFFNTGTEMFTQYLDTLINRTARNNGLLLTVAHQEAYQFDETLFHSLMYALTTQILGATQDYETAVALARQFYRYKPLEEKYSEPVYGTVSRSESHGWSMEGFGESHGRGEGNPVHIDDKHTYYSIDEQFELKSHAFLDLRPMRFITRIARFEGDRNGPVRTMTIEDIDREQWPNDEALAENKRILLKHHGVPVEAIRREIEARLAKVPPLLETHLEYEAPQYELQERVYDDDEDPIFAQKTRARTRRS